MYTTKAQICIRRDTAANFTSANPTLALGEIAYETDTRNIKVGDGSTAWTSLGYINPYRGGTAAAPTSTTVLGSGAGAALQSGAVGNVLVGDRAGNSITSGETNVFVGERAGFSATTTSNNVALGSAAYFSGTGNQNIAIGQGAAALGSGAWIKGTIVGYQAGLYNTASDITAVGANALDANTTGTQNTAVGFNALGACTTGTQNTAVGNDALRTNSTGVANVAVGTHALFTTTGDSNVAIGREALYSLGAGSNCVAVGRNALIVNTASDITAVGSLALDANTTGTGNTAVGKDALGANTTGFQNTAVGYLAGSNATTTTGHVSIGFQAGQNGGEGNVAIGTNALRSATAGYGVAVGYLASQNTTTGGNNVAIGTQALNANTAGSHNIAIGRDAALVNTASDIVAIGGTALDANTTGTNNTAVGKDALGSNTTGASNIAIGNAALSTNTTGNNQVAIGHQAAQQSNSTGNSLTAVGYAALGGTTTGSDNAAFGYFAANSGNHQSTTSLGHGAAATWSASYQQLTSCTNGVYVGWNARPNSASPSNEIVIGHGALGNGSNTTTIGNSSTTQAWMAGHVIPGRHPSFGGSGFGTSGFYLYSSGTDNGGIRGNFVGMDCNGTFAVRSNDANTNRLVVENNGNVTVSNGNFIVGTSGKGIDFSATSNSSGTMTSELLSDYEEGTWTPVITAATPPTTPFTMQVEAARYTKVGRLVTVQCYIATNNPDTAGASGNVQITGLPFTCAGSNNFAVGSVGYTQSWGDDYPSGLLVSPGSTLMTLEYRNAVDGATQYVQASDLFNGAGNYKNQIMLTVTYTV